MRELDVLFLSVNIIRNLVLKSKLWTFDGSILEELSDIIPNELNRLSGVLGRAKAAFRQRR